VLVVTTTMRMLNGVHGDSSNNGPVLSLGFGGVVSISGLEDWLIASLSSSNDSDHGSAVGRDGLSASGRKSNSSLLTVLSVSNDGGGSSGGSGELSSVSGLSFKVGDDGSLRHGRNGEDVSHSERSSLSSVDELTSVHTLNSDEILGSLLVSVWVSESDLSEGSTSTRVMNDLLHGTSDIAFSL